MTKLSINLQFTIMVRRIFKKRKQKKFKPSGRKRKIFATIVLAWSLMFLMFGKARWSSSQSSSFLPGGLILF